LIIGFRFYLNHLSSFKICESLVKISFFHATNGSFGYGGTEDQRRAIFT